MFEALEDHDSQIIALMDLARALATSQAEEAESAAMTLAWDHAIATAHPLAARFAERTGIAAPPPEEVAAARDLLTAAIARVEAGLQASGEDLYAPLAPSETP
jgi:hypothetical protein